MSTNPDDNPQTPSLIAHLLGPLRISVSGRTIDDTVWPRRTARSLLLLLLATPGHALPRDRLLDLLWPDASPSTALNALYVALHGLRRVLEPDLSSGRTSGFVEFTSDQVRLRPDLALWVDVDVFEYLLISAARQEPANRLVSLREALSLYADELLVTEPYEDWPIARREQLRGAWQQAVLEAADLELQLGHPLAAAQILPALLSRDPSDETVHLMLMRALASAGRGNDALRQFDRCVAVLRDELGMEPAAETIELANDIRSSSQSRFKTPVGAVTGLRFEDIPVAPNPLVGRQREVELIQDLLLDRNIRLVTITGAGGIGKTRLAIEAANQLADDFANGVQFVHLASLTDPDLMFPTLARALGMTERLDSTTAGNLVTFLRPLQLLLVLDNFEQILEASAGVADLLAGCPGLNVLVTSREPLRLRAEHIVTTPPLTVPPERPGGQGLEPELASRYDAVALFSQRARAIHADFSLTPRNVDEVVDLCQRLEGVPLAIELAAAAIQDHSPAEMLAALDDRFSFLAAGYRDLPARQQTMRDAIAWSYDLLGERDRQVFRRLSVFVGGIDEDAAMAVATTANDGDDEVIETVQALVRKNLLQ